MQGESANCYLTWRIRLLTFYLRIIMNIEYYWSTYYIFFQFPFTTEMSECPLCAMNKNIPHILKVDQEVLQIGRPWLHIQESNNVYLGSGNSLVYTYLRLEKYRIRICGQTNSARK